MLNPLKFVTCVLGLHDYILLINRLTGFSEYQIQEYLEFTLYGTEMGE